MSKVFVIQDMPRHDYSQAESFGDLVFIGKEDINSRFGLAATPANRRVLKSIVNALLKFNELDYLIIDGNPILITFAIHYLTHYCEINVNLLKWDNRSHQYIETLYPHDVIWVIDKETDNDNQSSTMGETS